MERNEIRASLTARWNDLIRSGQELSFNKGQVLVYEGHTPYGLFVLFSGAVGFSRDGQPVEADHIWNAPEGRVIGLKELLADQPFCCTCTALQDCRVVFVSKTVFKACIETPKY